MSEITQQIYPCAGSHGDRLTVICDPDDDHLRIEASVADSFYLTRNQVRGLMHQLTDWLSAIRPECDHDGYGTEETPWRVMMLGGEVFKEYPGGIFCKRCCWYLRDAPKPADWPYVG